MHSLNNALQLKLTSVEASVTQTSCMRSLNLLETEAVERRKSNLQLHKTFVCSSVTRRQDRPTQVRSIKWFLCPLGCVHVSFTSIPLARLTRQYTSVRAIIPPRSWDRRRQRVMEGRTSQWGGDAERSTINNNRPHLPPEGPGAYLPAA